MANKPIQTEFNCPNCKHIMVADVDLRAMVNYETTRLFDLATELLDKEVQEESE